MSNGKYDLREARELLALEAEREAGRFPAIDQERNRAAATLLHELAEGLSDIHPLLHADLVARDSYPGAHPVLSISVTTARRERPVSVSFSGIFVVRDGGAEKAVDVPLPFNTVAGRFEADEQFPSVKPEKRRSAAAVLIEAVVRMLAARRTGG